MDTRATVDRLEFSDCDAGGSAMIHVYLDAYYQGKLWRVQGAWHGDFRTMRFADVPSRDEAIEVVRMWFNVMRHR